jgi:hypothetical protein
MGLCYQTHSDDKFAYPGKGGNCVSCHDRQADIVMMGYAETNADILLCASCATQLSRKLLEDICAVLGDRHG